MRRHLSEFSKSPLDACVPAVPRLASRGPASSVRGGAPTFALPPPQRLALARARDALRHARFIIAIHSGSICPFGKFCFTRLKFVVSCKMRI